MRELCENARRVLFATLTAATLGVVIGMARGGSLARLAQLEVRLPWLALLAWLMQVALFVSPLGSVLQPWEPAIYLATVGAVAIVILANRALPGVALFGIGLLLNAAVTAANGGYMPVAEAALVSVGNTGELDSLRRQGHVQKATLMRPESPLWVLGDVLPVPPLGKVYSLGDVVAALGVVLVITQAMGSRPTSAGTCTTDPGSAERRPPARS
jgi:hypothetical protein